ncbi:MAG: hypothetical protein ACKVE4_06955 [Dissulfuribacterales bacterium]
MKHHITIRFYEELNDFLLSDSQKRNIGVSVDKGRTVGSLIKKYWICPINRKESY